MRAVRVRMSPLLLREALRFPPDVDIVDIKAAPGGFDLIVKSPAFRDVVPEELPIASPVWERRDSVVFVSWGIP